MVANHIPGENSVTARQKVRIFGYSAGSMRFQFTISNPLRVPKTQEMLEPKHFPLFRLLNSVCHPTLSRVRKPVLGRGLRALLKGTPVPGRSGKRLLPPAAGARKGLSPDLETLWRGKDEERQEPDASPSVNGAAGAHRNWSSIKWLLFTADVLLLLLTAVLVLKNPGPLTLFEWLLCFVSVGLGAVLAFVAVLGGR